MRTRAKKQMALLMAVVLVFGFSGCAAKPSKEAVSTTGFAFNTTYTITLYDGGKKEHINACVEKCSQYERIFSRTNENSELYQINQLSAIYKEMFRDTKEFKKVDTALNETLAYRVGTKGELRIAISEELREIVEKGLYYAEQSNGLFDITIGAFTQLWDFTRKKTIPKPQMIEDRKQYVDYRFIAIENEQLVIKKPGVTLDLGGIAKGFIADKLKEYLVLQGVTSGIINLGGNVLCIGKKSEHEKFHIGIQKPFADRNETKGYVAVSDLSVVSSGVYERYIETEDGKRYHHILDPKTGYSCDTDLAGITILSEQSVDGDGLSTICLSLGREKAMEYIDTLDHVYAIMITDKDEVYYSEGAEKLYSY